MAAPALRQHTFVYAPDPDPIHWAWLCHSDVPHILERGNGGLAPLCHFRPDAPIRRAYSDPGLAHRKCPACRALWQAAYRRRHDPEPYPYPSTCSA